MTNARSYRSCKCVIERGDVCGLRFSSLGQLHSHIENDHSLQPCKADRCGRGFRTQAEMTNHMRSQHPKCVCTECQYAAMHKTGITRHMINMHTELCRYEGYETYWCDECDRPFEKLEKHVASQHPERVKGNPELMKRFWCHACRRPYADLGIHKRVHHSRQKTPCPIEHCGYGTAQPGDLRKHLKRVHHRTPEELEEDLLPSRRRLGARPNRRLPRQAATEEDQPLPRREQLPRAAKRTYSLPEPDSELEPEPESKKSDTADESLPIPTSPAHEFFSDDDSGALAVLAQEAGLDAAL
ncbi:hypothetical protein J8273_8384 [Carpediemonas membranifera]|uniref:C2H2-type domain-containing protein n=1 Tax=Carpediemonas membranifera TaxID=201153 RepID=A0A8J6E6M1_9EUKA|nr:hypothetical protein J8273_8384 [Carpediemonas membranifera]|eukprot:KAG9389710.1 hypothetical protein J8273_8384 [Carpediemonas membranifera]